MQDIWSHTTRTSFCGALDRYWSSFARRWDVLLHGNPATEMLRASKVAAGGELGIGVGEEEWGSGEREVLEGFISRTDGLVDMVVSRFGSRPTPESKISSGLTNKLKQSWAGSGHNAGPSDGVIFTGVGATSRDSLAVLTGWIELLYFMGEEAFGILDNLNATRKSSHESRAKHRGRNRRGSSSSEPRIPPSILVPLNAHKQSQTQSKGNATSQVEVETEHASLDSGVLYKYLTLGYGSAWSFPAQQRSPSPAKAQLTTTEEHHTSIATSPEQQDAILKTDSHRT